MGRPSKHRALVGLKPAINRTLEKRKPISGTFIRIPIKRLARDQVDILQEALPTVDDDGNRTSNVNAGAKLVPRLDFLGPSSSFSQNVGVELAFVRNDATLELVAPPSSPADSTDNEMELPQSELLDTLGHLNPDKAKVLRPVGEQPLRQDDWVGNRMVDVEMVTQGLSHLLCSPDRLEQGFSADKLRRILSELPADCTPTATDSDELQDPEFIDSTILETTPAGEDHLPDALIDIQMPELVRKQACHTWDDSVSHSQGE